MIIKESLNFISFYNAIRTGSTLPFLDPLWDPDLLMFNLPCFPFFSQPFIQKNSLLKIVSLFFFLSKSLVARI
jgi:hypothetical protein